MRITSFVPILTALLWTGCQTSNKGGPDSVDAANTIGTGGVAATGGTWPGTGGATGGDGGLTTTGADAKASGADASRYADTDRNAGADGATDGTGTVADAGRPDGTSGDTNPHNGASLWIPFNKPGSTSTYYFDRCTWFTAVDGYCVLLANQTSSAGSKTSDLYKTTDGGRTFTLVATIDGGNTAIDGDMDVYVLSPSEIWYTTAFVGMGYSGTIGRSTDGGKSFQSLTAVVQKALADPGVTTVPDFPLWRLVKVNGSIWVGSYSSYLAVSADGGATWQRIAGPTEMSQASAPALIATQTDLLLSYTPSFTIALYRWNGSAFGKIEAAFPAPSGTDHGDTWWRSSPYGAGVVFVDQREYSWWGWPFKVSATINGGQSFQTILSGQSKATSDVAGLRDALVVNGSLAYVGGVFVGTDQNRYSQIRKSIDGGSTWSVVHSEPANDTYTSVVLDPTGRAHAMRHETDYYMNEYSYTGHYVLP